MILLLERRSKPLAAFFKSGGCCFTVPKDNKSPPLAASSRFK
jgi:hypothetical protein